MKICLSRTIANKKYKMRKFNSLICILQVTFIGTSLLLTNIIINKPTNVILYI